MSLLREHSKGLSRALGAVWMLVCLGLLVGAVSVCTAEPDSYRLGAEDVLSITVLRHPELSVAQVTVMSDGAVQAPVAGAVKVAGLTVAEATEAVAQALRGRLRDPEVTLAVIRPHATRVFVLGAVTRPGIYDLQPGWRVTEALAAAGGLVARPETINGAVFRLTKETLALDLPALLADGNAPANLPLQPGDVVNFAERVLRVSVAGQVQKPGIYDVPVGAGAVEAVAMAGGATPRAALSKVVVQRKDGSAKAVDLFRVLVGGEVDRNLRLEAGDLVMVPEAKAKIAVLGGVNRPGYYDIEEGLCPRTADAVAMAGGAVKRARLAQVAVVRTENGKAVRLPVNLEQVLRLGKTEADLPLRAGDLVYVPEGKVDWDFALRALTSVSLLGGAF